MLHCTHTKPHTVVQMSKIVFCSYMYIVLLPALSFGGHEEIKVTIQRDTCTHELTIIYLY